MHDASRIRGYEHRRLEYASGQGNLPYDGDGSWIIETNFRGFELMPRHKLIPKTKLVRRGCDGWNLKCRGKPLTENFKQINGY